jgi:hypothetical protein
MAAEAVSGRQVGKEMDSVCDPLVRRHFSIDWVGALATFADFPAPVTHGRLPNGDFRVAVPESQSLHQTGAADLRWAISDAPITKLAHFLAEVHTYGAENDGTAPLMPHRAMHGLRPFDQCRSLRGTVLDSHQPVLQVL